jgi:glycosyltransferase involved in cell wall biosynthesis
MKVALVHELLTMRGGAERVLRILAAVFPDAPIYTLLYNEEKLGAWFPKQRVRPAKFPMPYSLLPAPLRFNHHLYLRSFPRAVEAWDFSEFDLVISSSSAFAHGIITNGSPKHLCYVHSPARYLWDRTFDVLDVASRGCFGPLKRRYLVRVFHALRIWDAEVAPRADLLLVPSVEVQRRVELYWRKQSTVLHPPIEHHWLQEDSSPHQRSREDYFFLASTLVPYKRIDLAVAACTKLGKRLRIAGEGREKRRLQSMAGPTVEFLGYREGEELRALYSNAYATIFPGVEDFGLVPLESMAMGTPVIAFRGGGALETVIEGVTGTFFNEPTAVALEGVLQSFNPHAFNPLRCREHAAQFSSARFKVSLQKAIADLQAKN